MKKLFSLLTTIVLIVSFPLFSAGKTFSERGFISRITKPDFFLAVQMGLVPGFSAISKFGLNLEVTIETDPEDVWEQGGLYVFSETSDIDTLSSDSSSDIGNIILIRGIKDSDTTGESVGFAELNGKIKVLIYDNPSLTGAPIKFWRTHRIINNSPTGGELVGTLYCYVDSAITDGVPDDDTKIRAVVLNGNNITQMAIYTVPRGSVGFMIRGETGLLLSAGPAGTVDFARMANRARPFGKVFRNVKTVSTHTTGTSAYADKRSFPDVIPALTDVKAQIVGVSDTMGVWASIYIMLVEESLFPDEYLAGIGQPGY